LIQGLLVLNYSDPSAGYVYQSERWHGTLLTMAVTCISTIVNTFGASYLPLLEGFILAVHILGFVVILVALWVTGTPATAEAVWTEFKNSGGWPNLGLSCLVGQLTPIFSFLGECEDSAYPEQADVHGRS
jgi:choline transport protein